MAVNYAKNRQTLRKAHDQGHDSNHAAFREVKPKSYYLWGRKKGAELSRTQEFCDGWDRIFGVKDAGKSDASDSREPTSSDGS